ncbi:ArsR/SmtB family transcription factor [Amycolatopsis magusensis]|uniref:ArsR family transcriptional regulator n=1 Tax=Amycolatopsis magusensis TaxID=882444 RepID=A0ABS4PVX0_9PSEU|nr:metalloregulator ArsR/SmtB family transcription factor [Amycolatopsis magusensis]MBP2183567.1 ArsR family transcriptional regulator [Amycolatopsis magusensis]MDI5975023.1 metalloregulator ArsR/SmtB family transcription factor [Amycolatopsis magusensis]
MMSVPADVLPVELLRLVADPLRARIIGLLARETLCTTHLVEETGASQTNVSNHLRLLREAGLVTTEPCGRYTYYTLQPSVLRTLGAAFTALADTAEANVESKRACP